MPSESAKSSVDRTVGAREEVAAMSKIEDGPRRAWQRMLSGRRLDLLDPRADDVAIEDIAHGLARVARWNGQTRGRHAFSVAQHAVLVEQLFSAAWTKPETDGVIACWRLAALLHDAPEYVIGDLISPFKAAIGLDYRVFEQRLQAAVHRRFRVPEVLPDDVAVAIKSADRTAAYIEATELAEFSIAEADTIFGRPTHRVETGQVLPIEAWPVDRAQAAFLAKFQELRGDRGQ
jgi:uncharacterized protein